MYKDIEKADGVPRIVDDETFYAVQDILNSNKQAPAKSKAKEEYLLTPKLFCGQCRERGYENVLMTGYSGTSKMRKMYYYYACNEGRYSGQVCKKKRVKKHEIEDLVIEQCLKILTDENIDRIANEIMACDEKTKENHELRRLQKLLKENLTITENLLKALENGQAADIITSRLQKKTEERAELERQISNEKAGRIEFSYLDIKFFLTSLRNGDMKDIGYKRLLITVFVNRIYLYDDKMICIFNAENRPVTVSVELLDEIDAAVGSGGLGSCLRGGGAPRKPACGGFFLTLAGVCLFVLGSGAVDGRCKAGDICVSFSSKYSSRVYWE